MNEDKLLTEQGRLFGFRMPNCDPEQMLEIAKKSAHKKVSQSCRKKDLFNFRIGCHEAIARVSAFRSC